MKEQEMLLECKRLAVSPDHEAELIAFVRSVAVACAEIADVYDYEDSGFEIRSRFGLLPDEDS